MARRERNLEEAKKIVIKEDPSLPTAETVTYDLQQQLLFFTKSERRVEVDHCTCFSML